MQLAPLSSAGSALSHISLLRPSGPRSLPLQICPAALGFVSITPSALTL